MTRELATTGGAVSRMQPFRRNLDGYYDVHAELVSLLQERIDRQLQRGDRQRARIDSPEALREHRQRMRVQLLTTVGGLFERTPLRPQRSVAIEHEDYTVETVVFESLPGVYVTANFYRPSTGDVPVPGVLFLCGHAAAGKAAPSYQRACSALARAGIAVLAVDPVGQGERKPPADRADACCSPVEIHTRLGGGCTLVGDNLARYFIWDALRARESLQTRTDVDSERIGVVGNSGGGLQTAFLMLLDDSVQAAMPCSFVTSKAAYAKTGQAQDAEQILPDAIRVGPRYDDVLLSFAPRPLCIGASQSDFLPIDGVHQSYDRASAAYARFDATENLDLVVAESTHGLDEPLRTAAVNWFREQFLDDPTRVEADTSTVASADALGCVAEESVFTAFDTAVGIDDLLAKRVAARGPTTPPETHGPYATTIRDRVRDRFGLDRPRCPLSTRIVETERDGQLLWEKLFFESEPDVHLSAIAARTRTDTPALATLVVLARGTDQLSAYRDDIATLARDREYVLVVDLRGMGAVRARDVNTPQNNGGEYFDTHGTEYKLAADALMTGGSLLGMRVFDLVRAGEYLQKRFDPATIGVVGAGRSSLYAILAGAGTTVFDPLCVEAVPAFYERAVDAPAGVDPGLLCYGIVGSLDVPQLRPALEDRQFHRTAFPEEGLPLDVLTRESCR